MINKLKIKIGMLLVILACRFPTTSWANETSGSAAHSFFIGTNDFILDGSRLQIRCGEIHAARVPKEYWRNRLQLAKAMGLNTICAYLFWNQIDPPALCFSAEKGSPS